MQDDKSAKAVFMIGQVVSHYHILSELGAGGMGVVYLANDTVLKRRVAIKMLNGKHFSRKNEPQPRLLREARALSQINHPNIATIYDYGETSDGQQFIVMEYVDGEPLNKLIAQRALTIKGSVGIIGAVAAALSEAHHRGIIHRDIKPSNIILSRRDEVKVLDFGLAKQIEDETLSPDGPTGLQSGSATKTREGTILGTPLYLSPEQATGAPIDERSDIFSLGSVLYECLTGQAAFYANSSIEICARILRDDPPPPSKINPAVTAGLDRIIAKALAKDISLRYQSAREFRQDLSLADFKTTDEELSLSAKTLTDETTSGVETTPADEIDTKSQRHGSTAEESKRFSLSFDGLQTIWSGIGSLGKIILSTLVLLLICTSGYVGYRVIKKQPAKDLAQSLQFQRLPISGNIKEAIISPDGKYVATIIEEGGRQAIQLTELATSSDIRIASPSEHGYRGLSFSPDNNYVYYLEEEMDTATLYRVSKLGGNNRKILENVNTPVTFSPSGSRISFVRYNLKEQSALMTANEDGTNEQTLETYKFPDEYVVSGLGGPAWAPLGDVIACLTVDRATQPHQMHVEAIDIKDGSRRRVNKEAWYQIERVSWLADGRGLVLAGSNTFLNSPQLFVLSFPDGEVIKLTNDPNSYLTISSAADSSILLTLELEMISNIWLMPSDNLDQATTLTASQNKGITDIAWLSENTVIHVANGTGGLNIWSENMLDGKNSQLTSVGGSNDQPSVSPDKRYIVFVSNRSGFLNIWRMNSDGTNQVQLTNGKYEDMPRITPDGKWVVYHSPQSTKNGYIWKVSIDGGEPVRLVNQDALYPAVSPDGKMLACFIWDKNIKSKLELGLFSLETGSLVKEFTLPRFVRVSINKLRWSPDAQKLVFVSDVNGVSNLWVQPLNGTTPKPVTDFKESQIFDFAWSPNGQQLACVRGNMTSYIVLIKGMNLN